MRARQRHFNQRAAGATLVLDARRITGLSDGDAVGQWDDKSASGWNVTQSDSAKKPTYKTAIQGGQPVVRADGAGDRLISSSVSTNQTFCEVVVFKRSSSDANGAVICDSYNNTQCAHYTGTGSDSSSNFAIVAGSTRFEYTAKDAEWKIVVAQFSAATSYASTNGIKNSASSSIGTNGLNGISIFDLRGNPNPLVGDYSMNGDIAQLIIVPSALSDPLRKRLEFCAALAFKLPCS